jgi:hypothetical protein
MSPKKLSHRVSPEFDKLAAQYAPVRNLAKTIVAAKQGGGGGGHKPLTCEQALGIANILNACATVLLSTKDTNAAVVGDALYLAGYAQGVMTAACPS